MLFRSRDPNDSDHENLRHMLIAFNGHSRCIMLRKSSRDIELQWQSVRSIKRGIKLRVRKKQISRLTYEYMQLIRQCHPVRSSDGNKHRDRVKGMVQLQSEIKAKFLV